MELSFGGKKSIWFTIVDSLSAETLECSHTIGVPGGGHHVLGVGCRVGVQVRGHARAHAGEVVTGVPGGAHAVAEAWQPGVRWVMSICCWLRFLKWLYYLFLSQCIKNIDFAGKSVVPGWLWLEEMLARLVREVDQEAGGGWGWSYARLLRSCRTTLI